MFIISTASTYIFLLSTIRYHKLMHKSNKPLSKPDYNGNTEIPDWLKMKRLSNCMILLDKTYIKRFANSSDLTTLGINLQQTKRDWLSQYLKNWFLIKVFVDDILAACFLCSLRVVAINFQSMVNNDSFINNSQRHWNLVINKFKLAQTILFLFYKAVFFLLHSQSCMRHWR